MIRSTCLAAVGIAVFLAGCKQDKEAVYLHDVDVSDNARQPLPASGLRLTYNADLTKVRVGPDPDLSDLRPPRKFSDEDAETIKGIPGEMIEAMEENAWEDIPSYFVPDQEEQLQKFVPLVTPLMDKITALNETVTEKLGPPPSAMPGTPSMDPAAQLAMVKEAVDLARIDPVDGENAVMTIVLEAAQGAALKLPFTLIEGEWYIAIPQFPAAEQIDTIVSMAESVAPSVTTTLESIQAEVDAGTIKDYGTLQVKAMTALAPVIGQISQMGQNMPSADPSDEDSGADDGAADEGEDGDK